MTTTPSTTFALPSRRQKRLWQRRQFFSVLRDAVDSLATSLASPQGAKAFEKWQASVASLYGEIFARPRMRDHCLAYARQLEIAATSTELVFALHTIYSLLSRAVTVQHLISPYRHAHLSPEEFFRTLADPEFYRHEFGVRNFLPALWDEEIVEFVSSHGALLKLMEFSNHISGSLAAAGWQNVLAHLYQTIIPGSIRHDLGEFFTPDWLAGKTMAMAGFTGESGKIVFDPGCGAGIFLLIAAAKKLEKPAPLNDLLASVIGCDLNPLSVLAARLNLLLLLAKNFALPLPEVEFPIFHYDAVFQTPLGNSTAVSFRQRLSNGCDYLVGNPPWISWNCLPPAYRKRLEKDLLAEYVLFDFHGQSARLGHGNDDYLATFTLVAVHRYLRQHGLCSFIIKQPLLTNVSGKTFRHFSIRHIAETIPLRVVKAVDLRALDPFGIANETAILVLEKGEKTSYPVEYEIWSRNNGQVETKAERAQPVHASDLTSPWVILSENWAATKFMEGHNPYEIRHGLKHDAADILIVDVVEKFHHYLRIKRRSNVAAEIYEIEPDWVYPFLQPRQLQRWGISGYGYFVLPQRQAGEDNETELAAHFPLTHAFLKKFESHFFARRSKVFLNRPFYGLFGLGKYTVAPYKVCWVGLGFRSEFAVVETLEDSFLGRKTAIPDGTIYFVPFAGRDEAHFVCALLNAPVVGKFLSARSGKSKRGLSKKVVEQLALPKFNREDERHVYLAEVSIRLHGAFRQKILAPDFSADFEKIVLEVFTNN